jgi:ribonuclease P/MRP protein subunit RPP40
MPVLKPPSEVDTSYGADFEDYAVEVHEWLSLILLESPRIRSDDKIDAFLSRYVPPGGSTTSSNLVKITWQGFLSPSWAHKTFVQALLAAPRDVWFAYYVVGFGESFLGGNRDCTILKLPNASNEYVLWEVV